MDDGKDIFNHFSVWRQVGTTENHEEAILLLTYPSYEVNTEPCESVLVADHNFSEVSWQNLSQKGFLSFSFKVRSTSDIFEEDCVWVLESIEVVGLPFEVFFLLVTTDSRVDGNWFVFSLAEYAVDIVASLVWWGSNGINFSEQVPGSKGFFWDLEDFAGLRGGDIFYYVRWVIGCL